MDLLKQSILQKKHTLNLHTKQYKRRGESTNPTIHIDNNTVEKNNHNNNHNIHSADNHSNTSVVEDDIHKKHKAEHTDSSIQSLQLQSMNKNINEISQKTINISDPIKSTQIDELANIHSVVDIHRDAYDSDEQYIYIFIQYILQRWKLYIDTNNINNNNKTLQQYKQTKQYIKPLLKQLHHKSLSSDMLRNIYHITYNCINGNYIQANEYYLLLAIGRAAWPMGVTMVGIHERAGREKLHSDSIAHILNNDTCRKYIQSCKRIITVCSILYPNKNDNWQNVKKADEIT